MQKPLQENKQQTEERAKRCPGVQVWWICKDTVDSNGNRVRLINPNLPPWERELEEDMAAQMGIRVIDLEEDPKSRGQVYQESRAEKYPTIRWHFPWGRYSVGGTPDGMADDFVYEYKTTRERFLLRFVKPVALAQADLYGHFFARPKKRVQIHVVKENATETWEQPVDPGNAERTLAAFARVDAGQPARPPRAWKCRKCAFRTTCPISQAK
jgi:hypothetical protein